MNYYLNNRTNQDSENPTKIFYNFTTIRPYEIYPLTKKGRNKSTIYPYISYGNYILKYHTKKLPIYIVINNSVEYGYHVDYVNKSLLKLWDFMYYDVKIAKNIIITILYIDDTGKVNYLIRNKDLSDIGTPPEIKASNHSISVNDFFNDASSIIYKNERNKTQKVKDNSHNIWIIVFSSADSDFNKATWDYNMSLISAKKKEILICCDYSDNENTLLASNSYFYFTNKDLEDKTPFDDNIALRNTLNGTMTYYTYEETVDFGKSYIETERAIQYFTYIKAINSWMCYWTFEVPPQYFDGGYYEDPYYEEPVLFPDK